MEKSPFLKNFIFIFCCAVFDFTVAVSAENYSTKSWLFNIGPLLPAAVCCYFTAPG